MVPMRNKYGFKSQVLVRNFLIDNAFANDKILVWGIILLQFWIPRRGATLISSCVCIVKPWETIWLSFLWRN